MKKLILLLLIISTLVFSNESQYKPDENGYYDIEVAPSLISEYSYSSLLRNSIHLGFSLEAYKFYKPGIREMTLSSFSVLGDFYNKSILIKLSMASIRFYLDNNTYFQFGFLGVGDSMDIIIFPKSGKVFTRNKLSLKIGRNIDLNFPTTKLRIYAKIGTEADQNNEIGEDQKKFYEIDGVYFGLGITLEYNKIKN